VNSDALIKKCIAFVSIRYGIEVNGGAEFYCRQLAEKLTDYYEVEVLTTCAIDYVTWKDEYKEGTEVLNGVTVRRFKVDYERNPKKFNAFTPKVLDPCHTIQDEIKWMEMQGPVSSRLLNYLSENKDKYYAIIFIPYLYYTTYFGMKIAPEKSFLISAAHDEPYIKLDIFKDMFIMPRGFIFLTEEEQKLVHKLFNNSQIPFSVIGSGIDIPENVNGSEFRKKYNIYDKFMIYIGRIDESKGCKELFEYFCRYKEQNGNDLKLVLMGKPVIEVPEQPDIISLGFVDEADKFSGLSEADFLVLPSKFESLSIVVLESMALGKPVLVDGNCTVTRGHCIKSNAGLYYMNYNEFEACINLLISNKVLVECMGKNGVKYIQDNYLWRNVIKKFSDIIDEALNRNSKM